MYLWSQNWTPPLGDRADILVRPEYRSPPLGYKGVLTLDYVPDYLNWTGPMQFELDMNTVYILTLPVPTVTDPLQGVRMHFTVYAVPEPSGLLALGAWLAALAGAAVKRRM